MSGRRAGASPAWLRTASSLLLGLHLGGAVVGATAEALLDDPAQSLRTHVEGALDPACHTPHNHFLCQVFRWETPLAGGGVTLPADAAPRAVEPHAAGPAAPTHPDRRAQPPGRAPPQVLPVA